MNFEIGQTYLDSNNRQIYIFGKAEFPELSTKELKITYFGRDIDTWDDIYYYDGKSESSTLVALIPLNLDIQAGKVFLDSSSDCIHIIGKSKFSGVWIGESVKYGEIYQYDVTGKGKHADLLKEAEWKP
jgi:hypothetical protein